MLSLGSVLKARYRVDRLLEIGALEGQYRGWDLESGGPVIIKELLPQPDLEPDALSHLQAAFDADAAALKQLQHPHIVRVLDHFCAKASDQTDVMSVSPGPSVSAYLILQAAPGQSLAALIEREGAISEKRVLLWAQQLLSALAYYHGRGIVHRDIRPENVLVTPDDQAMLTNFELIALWNPNDPRTWTAKRVMGTPQYAPPETWGMKNTQIDARSDIYSLGATLYHALTGEQPLTASERTSNPYRFLQVKALAPRVDQQLRAAILRAMELPRDRRFQGAAEMAAALTSHQPGRAAFEPQPAPFLPAPKRFPWLRALGLLLSAAVITFAGLLGTYLNQTVMSKRALPTASAEIPTSAPGPAEPLPSASALSSEAGGEVTLGPTTTPSPDPALTSTATLQPRQTRTSASVGPTPPPDWQAVVEDGFDSNVNGWLVSEAEDDWGSVSRQLVDGSYRWEIVATQAVGRWCTPELPDDAGIVDDFYVSVHAQRIAGPETAAYGLILRHDEGSYYLFSARDDGYYQFSLWYGYAWQPIVDWTQTESIRSGEVNRLSVSVVGSRFSLYLNDDLMAEADNDQLPRGEAGLAISTAATEGTAVFVFDDFALWAPAE